MLNVLKNGFNEVAERDLRCQVPAKMEIQSFQCEYESLCTAYVPRSVSSFVRDALKCMNKLFCNYLCVKEDEDAFWIPL